MRFNNWRFSEAVTYVTTKKAVKLHPLRAPSGFSSIAFQAAVLEQRVPEPGEPSSDFLSVSQQSPDGSQPAAQ